GHGASPTGPGAWPGPDLREQPDRSRSSAPIRWCTGASPTVGSRRAYGDSGRPGSGLYSARHGRDHRRCISWRDGLPEDGLSVGRRRTGLLEGVDPAGPAVCIWSMAWRQIVVRFTWQPGVGICDWVAARPARPAALARGKPNRSPRASWAFA